MSNPRRIFFLISAILLLSLYYLHSEFRAKEKSYEELESKKILTLSEGSIVEALTLKTDDKPVIQMAKEGTHWWVLTPRRYPADDLIADGLVSALTGTTWDRSFDAGEIQLKDMGLDSPSQRVEMSVRGREKSEKMVLLIGREAPMGRYVYVMWEGGSQVFMVYDQFARSFDKTLYSLRKKRLFDLASDQVYAADVTLEDRAFTLIKWKGEWTVVARGSSPADPAAVEAFISDLTSLYVKEFLDELNPKNPDLGLYPRKYTITLTDFSGSSYSVCVGKENKDRQAFYAFKDGEDLVLLLSSSSIKVIPATGDFFKKKRRLGKLDPEKVQRLELEKSA